MASLETVPKVPESLEKKDFLLTEFTAAGAAKLLKKKQVWLINPLSGHGFHYPLVLSNLTRTYCAPDQSSVETVRHAIHEGLPKAVFEQLKAITGISGDFLASVVGIPARTLARREVFKPDETGAILRVAGAFQKTLEVFEDLGEARAWFSSGKRALGGASPVEFCDTEPGAAEVVNLLGRIEHGVFS
ncbi:MAG: DUF2384 domain-containing protein [Akkermansiaceae bacterium]|nr:DUF2384 domain-containing protein [Akkermansiaceae bacterium]MDB4327652.1 DUF2384 domain-containing protein [bacterium]MDB4412630.1 DUF2384 domain-containing protein [bacterium]MDB4504407.1 DUF2384 domain-containing protein [Akkermansiaceae bacterium]MDB4547222.1 DUF2384 domain-containing protein [Akkermansiaceae bacterium]